MKKNTKNPRKYEYEIPAGYAARIENNRVIIEPKEREDEKIRKEIIEFLTDGIWSETTIGEVKQSQRYAKWIAYLGKQKDEHLDNDLTFNKPAEWSKDIICKAVKEVGLTQHQINWLKNNVFPPEQEWSEEDEAAFGDLMWCIEQARKSAKDENDMGDIWFAENWVKNRLKSIRPTSKNYQPKQKRCQRCGGEGIITVYNHYEDLHTGVEHKDVYERICPNCGGKGFINQ